ncbi:Zn-ribbon domain-containing OB-fold protein [Thermomonospora amylolytica]|uniref:Zn-ribbon domain-containing OB-fold protein n=1 Tax=Thermomonospora amylolytica TaxID=1411117 RepID=UPI0018E589EE|nr:OB-fold domain-containing protein [Thermomonospora amylolytica]
MPTSPALPFGPGPGGAPVLHGQRCTWCGHVSFPRQPYGCEECGSPDTEPHDLPGTGVVHAAATVHRHPDPRVPVPYTVVSVLLDDGPLVRGACATPTPVGTRVRPHLDTADPDRPQLLFTPAP